MIAKISAKLLRQSALDGPGRNSQATATKSSIWHSELLKYVAATLAPAGIVVTVEITEMEANPHHQSQPVTRNPMNPTNLTDTDRARNATSITVRARRLARPNLANASTIAGGVVNVRDAAIARVSHAHHRARIANV